MCRHGGSIIISFLVTNGLAILAGIYRIFFDLITEMLLPYKQDEARFVTWAGLL